MSKLWFRSALAALLGGVSAPVWADPPVFEQPSEPVVSFVGRRGHDYFTEPAPPQQLVERSILSPNDRFDDHDDSEHNGLPTAEGGCFTAYGGTYFVYPQFQNNVAFSQKNAGGGLNNVNFTNHMSFAPLAGAAYVAPNGWGVRGRWFGISEETSLGTGSLPGQSINFASPLAPASAAAPGSIQATSSLQINSWEGEVTRSLKHSQWDYLVGAGVRYSQINQSYNATRPITDGTLLGVHTDHNYGGIGPTLSLAARRNLGIPGLSLYSSAHAAVLFGHNHEDFSATVAAGQGQSLSRRDFHSMPVGEFEAGVEFAVPLGRGKLFMQAGCLGQMWWKAGSSSNYDPTSASTTNDSNFGLLGVAGRIGYTF